jgi:hypothetical protein
MAFMSESISFMEFLQIPIDAKPTVTGTPAVVHATREPALYCPRRGRGLSMAARGGRLRVGLPRGEGAKVPHTSI